MDTIRGKNGTKKPTGLSLTRNGNKFVLTWKKGEASSHTISDQQYQRRVNYETASGTAKSQSWTSQSITATATKESTAVTWSDWYPTTKKKMTSLTARVRARRAPYVYGSMNIVVEDWSDWSSKSYDIDPPLKPSASTSLDSVLWNKCVYSWSYSDDNPIHRPFADIQYQSILVKDCTETDGSKLKWSTSNVDWKTGTTGSTGSITITEDTSLISGKSYTRWVRVRARGAGGPSAWVYRKHVFAYPNKAVISKATVKEVSSGTNIYLKWTAQANAARPIDQTTVQYLTVTPLSNLACPPGQTWTDALVQGDTSGTDAASFTQSISITDDEVLFVRVNTQHDDQLITEGTPKLVKVGRLADPDNLSVTYNSGTYQATIDADNNSSVPDSFLAVKYTTEDNPTGFIVGIIPHNQTTTGTIQCPAYTGTIDFGVYAVQGTYTLKTRADGVTQYVVKSNMTSDIVWDGGTIPAAPTLSGERVDTETVRLTWDWSWSDATGAELSWSDHADAWESTDEPDKYEVTSIYSSAWNVTGLDEGKIWYFRIRLFKDDTFGDYSDIVSVNLSSAPLIPSLELSQPIITDEGSVTASWTYLSTDGTAQALAEIVEATLSGGVWTYSDPIAQVETAQHVTLEAAANGWTSGYIYNIAVRTTSASGQKSAYSDPVPVTIADALTISVTTNLSTVTLDGDSVNGLTSLPLTVTVTGAGAGGITTVSIERLLSYFMDRPDESIFNGYAGETVALVSQVGEATISLDRAILLSSLDDGAWYKLICTIEDGFGQSLTEETQFMVAWSHQAEAPTATIIIDRDDRSAQITVDTPSGAVLGDTADIYRLSADKPELIVEGADYATTYVDPYPTIREFGGYRIVMITKDGDYIDANNVPAWTDYMVPLDVPFSIINFGGESVELLLNQNISSSWTKDFKETQYLGGSVQGDWNKAVSRTGTVSSYMVRVKDNDTIRSLRRLAVYPGICHVRTIDGSSYAADVQVSEDHDFDTFGTAFSLKITRVDPEGLDGILLTDWEVSS